ncbi:MAG: hypothetical protein WEA77_06290 [Hyphomonas sp.]
MIHTDPLPRVAARRTLPFWWSQVEKMGPLDAHDRVTAGLRGLALGLVT